MCTDTYDAHYTCTIAVGTAIRSYFGFRPPSPACPTLSRRTWQVDCPTTTSVSVCV